MKCFAITPLGHFVPLLTLFGFLPCAVDFLVRPILDPLDVRRSAFPSVLCSSETGNAISLQGFELARFPVA
jgi:hypothetical protein